MNFKLLKKVVQWIVMCFKHDGSIPVQPLVQLVERQQKVLESNGLDRLIAWNKAVRSNLLNYLSGNPSRDPLSACTQDGIPVALKGLIPFVRDRSYFVINMTLTVLMSTRSIKLEAKPDISTIELPFTGDISNVSIFVSDFWRELGYRPQVSTKGLQAKLNHYRTKKGPNGHSLSTSVIDANNLPDSLINSLKTVGGPLLSGTVKDLRNQSFLYYFLSRYMKIFGGTSFRRLSYFPDKEGKTRVIGILDWWSQAALKPLHTYIANALKKIKQDCTLDQAKFKETLKGAEIYYSVDLSAATDRFPIALIDNLLKAQLPHPYVDAWHDIMVGYPFDYKDQKVSYSVGNPMGAYSSFNSFALTHHYLIFYCCKVLGKKWKSLPYALLGDDIVIGDKDVGDMYMEVIKGLGLDYSPLKTHKSKNFYEFAKRYYLDGVEISPFPFSAIKECQKSVTQLTTLLFELSGRNFVPSVSIASSISLYHSFVKELPSRFVNKLTRRASLCEGVLKTVHGRIPVDEWINSLIKQNSYRLPVLSPDVCKNILMNVTVQAFADSNLLKQVSVHTRDYPLTGLAQNGYLDFLEWKKGLSEEFKSTISFISWTCAPIYTAHKAVQEEFESFLNEIEMRDKLGHDWSYKMRTFALPKSDKSLLENERYSLSKVSKVFGDLVEEQLQILQMYPSLIPSDQVCS